MAGIAHPVRNPKRWSTAAKVAATALVVGLLAGCSTGRVDEARLAATREATRGAVLSGAQATNVVEEFFKPTASPMPTQTPAPTLATLTLSTSLGSNNEPRNEVESVGNGSTVYAVAEMYGLRPGQVATAVWTTSDGAEVYRSSIGIDRSYDRVWVPFEWNAGGAGSGQYAVYIYVDELLLNSLVFRVN